MPWEEVVVFTSRFTKGNVVAELKIIVRIHKTTVYAFTTTEKLSFGKLRLMRTLFTEKLKKQTKAVYLGKRNHWSCRKYIDRDYSSLRLYSWILFFLKLSVKQTCKMSHFVYNVNVIQDRCSLQLSCLLLFWRHKWACRNKPISSRVLGKGPKTSSFSPFSPKWEIILKINCQIRDWKAIIQGNSTFFLSNLVNL